jgi:putative spermidine/putrescine transport system permease protein
VTGPAERTLPRQMFNGIRENISPVITAAATLLILLSVLLLTTLELLRRRNERLRGIRPG